MPPTNSPVPAVNQRWLEFWRLVLAEQKNLTVLQAQREAKEAETERSPADKEKARLAASFH